MESVVLDSRTESFSMAGRGVVFTANKQWYSYEQWEALKLGGKVTHLYKTYEITGIERAAILTDPIRTKDTIGLRVKELKESEEKMSDGVNEGLSVGVGLDDNVIFMQFGAPVTRVVLSGVEARKIAESLSKFADLQDEYNNRLKGLGIDNEN